MLDGQPVDVTVSRRSDELAKLCTLNTREHLSNKQKEELENFLECHQKRFSEITGPSTAAEHVITLKHDRPLKQRYYPRYPAMQKVINEEVDELLTAGRIEPPKSAYSSPIVLVRKKQGSLRMCID